MIREWTLYETDGGGVIVGLEQVSNVMLLSVSFKAIYAASIGERLTSNG